MIIYNYPLCTAPFTSNLSRTERLKLRFADCPHNLGFDETQGCLASCYCQPYIEGDSFTYQIIHSDSNVLPVSINVYLIDGSDMGVIVLDYTGFNNEYGYQTNIVFDMDAISLFAGADCFKVQVNFAVETYMSEPFCKVKCNSSSILLCSDYVRKDCNGVVFSFDSDFFVFPTPEVSMSNCMRLKAVLEKTSVAVENTYEEISTSLISRYRQTKGKIIDQYELRVWDIPEWQVKRLQALLAGTNLTLTDSNGDVYNLQVRGGFDKGNATGSNWFPVIKLEGICQTFNKRC